MAEPTLLLETVSLWPLARSPSSPRAVIQTKGLGLASPGLGTDRPLQAQSDLGSGHHPCRHTRLHCACFSCLQWTRLILLLLLSLQWTQGQFLFPFYEGLGLDQGLRNSAHLWLVTQQRPTFPLPGVGSSVSMWLVPVCDLVSLPSLPGLQ